MVGGGSGSKSGGGMSKSWDTRKLFFSQRPEKKKLTPTEYPQKFKLFGWVVRIGPISGDCCGVYTALSWSLR